jgi:hypothetical protein
MKYEDRREPPRPKKGETSEEQSQKHVHHFIWHQGDCSQRICPGRPNSHLLILMCLFTATALNCARTSPRTLATKELAVVSRLRTASHFILHKGIIDQKNTIVAPHPPYFSLFSRLKIKLKGRHIDTTEVNDAESQAVLNTLAEHDFQDTLRTSRMMVVSRPKVSFLTRWQLQSRNLWMA